MESKTSRRKLHRDGSYICNIRIRMYVLSMVSKPTTIKERLTMTT